MSDNNTAAASTAPVTTDTSSSSTESNVETPQAAAPSPKASTSTPPPAPKKTYKLKVDGREEEMDEDSVVKLAQMGRSANKRFQEAAEARKQAEGFIKMLKEDPAQVLQNPAIGVDLRKFAEEYLLKQYEQEKMSPEQRTIKEQEARLKQYDQEKKDQESKRQTEERQKLEDHYSKDYDTKFTEALSSGGLPKSPKTIKRMADYMSLALEHGIDVEPKNVVELVRADYISEINDLFSQSEGDSLLKILGDGVANKIRKADLARLRAPMSGANTQQITEEVTSEEPSTPRTAAPSKPKEEAKKYRNIHEWRAALDKKIGR